VEELNNPVKIHKMTMSGRKTCFLSGIRDVLSFDPHEIVLETEQGMLSIKGEDLHVSRLTLEKGEVDVDGRLSGFTYDDAPVSGKEKATSLLGRLFR